MKKSILSCISRLRLTFVIKLIRKNGNDDWLFLKRRHLSALVLINFPVNFEISFCWLPKTGLLLIVSLYRVMSMKG